MTKERTLITQMTTQMMQTKTDKKARACGRKVAQPPSAGAAQARAPVPHGPKIKRCGRCHKLLPIGKFYRRRLSRDGLTGWCIGCCNAFVRERREVEAARRFGPLPEDPRKRAAELERRKAVVLAERPPELVCPDCGLRFKRQDYLDTHRRVVHPPETEIEDEDDALAGILRRAARHSAQKKHLFGKYQRREGP